MSCNVHEQINTQSHEQTQFTVHRERERESAENDNMVIIRKSVHSGVINSSSFAKGKVGIYIYVYWIIIKLN